MEENNIEQQNEIEQMAHQMVREEPLKKVETFDNKSITNLGKTSKKKNWIPIAIAIVITIFFLVLVFCFLRLYPKYALIKSLDMWTDSLEIVKIPSHSSQYNWDEKTTKGTATMKIGDFLFSSMGEIDNETLSILQKINALSFQLETRTSKKDQKSFVNMNGKMEDENFLNLSYINYDQQQYILLKDVLGTYLQLEEQDVVINNIDEKTFPEDVEYVWNVLKKSFKKNMKPSYIKKQPEKISIDGKTIYTTKISFVIDEKADYELSKNIIKDLKADKRAYDFLVNLYPEFANKEEIKSEEAYQICYSVNVTKGIPKIVKASLSTDENEEFSLTKGDDYVFEYEQNGSLLFRIIVKEEKDGFKMKLQLLKNNLEMVLVATEEENSTIYNFSMEANGAMLEITSTHTLEDQKKDSFQEKIQLLFHVKAQGVSLEIMNINLDLKTTKGATFDEIKDSNSKLITDLTEEEKQKIQFYFENIGQLFAL